MINLLLGAPGGGKSYEATVYHILKAVTNGRRVVTNLPLNVDYFEAIEPGASALLVMRADRLDHRAFSTVEDYGDPWRHPESGAGPLYVIDECHRPLPRKDALREVEEWFAEHRHERADVLLLTQSYGKCSKPIMDLVQIVYRVRKNVAFGSSTSYTRKVQDGLRGAVMNTAIRKYNPKYFGLYTSHTKSSEYGSELQAQDVRPLWQHWSVYGAVGCLLLAVWMGFQGYLNPFRGIPGVEAKTHEAGDMSPAFTGLGTAETPYLMGSAAHSKVSPVPTEVVPTVAPPAPVARHPFLGLSFQVVAQVESAQRLETYFALAQNGQQRFQVSGAELQTAGYVLENLMPCAVRLRYELWEQVATCASARVTLDIPSPL